MKRVILIGNHDIVIYNFRYELIKELLHNNYDVIIALPYGEKVELLKEEGCRFYETQVDRRGTNIFKDLKLFLKYLKILNNEKPCVVLTYTIKPNIYGGLAARFKRIPYVTNITGLGSAIETRGIVQKISLFLYKVALKDVKCVFFQNKENMDFFKANNICRTKCELLPGSGVNLKQHKLLDYPPEGTIVFAFVGRLMKEKGIDEYLEAANRIKPKYSNVEFHICGFCEETYLQRIEELQNKDIVIYHGMVKDMIQIYKRINCIVLPTYHEGMSNVLLEAAAHGRPAIASNISGCKEIIDEGVTGFLVSKCSKEDLICAIEKFINLSYIEKSRMGVAARKKVEINFDRTIIVDKYMEIIKEM